MKVIIEIENNEELKKIKKFLKKMKATINIQEKTRSEKLMEVFNFADKNPITKNKIEIPNREERNAR